VITAVTFIGLESASSASFAPRAYHSAVWTGNDMIVWGGYNSSYYPNYPYSALFSDGARYNPASNSWTAVSPSTLSAREYHTAVWTGTDMIVWGGNYLNDGARYNPASNSWTTISPSFK